MLIVSLIRLVSNASTWAVYFKCWTWLPTGPHNCILSLTRKYPCFISVLWLLYTTRLTSILLKSRKLPPHGLDRQMKECLFDNRDTTTLLKIKKLPLPTFRIRSFTRASTSYISVRYKILLSWDREMMCLWRWNSIMSGIFTFEWYIYGSTAHLIQQNTNSVIWGREKALFLFTSIIFPLLFISRTICIVFLLPSQIYHLLRAIKSYYTISLEFFELCI